MKKDVTKLWLILILSALFFPAFGAKIQTVRVESEKYSISLQGEADPREMAPDFVPVTVLDKEENREWEFSLSARWWTQGRAKLYQDRLLLEIGSHRSEILIVNLRTGEVIDTIWGLRGIGALSKNGRFMAYVEHIPRRDYGKPYREVLLIYDLERSPVENRLDSQYVSDPMASGIPVFPEENVEQKNYDYTVERWEQESFFFSPFLWLEDDRIFFVEWRHPGVNYLIRIDLTKGIRQPEITRRRIEPCLSEDITGPIRKESSSRLKNTLQISELEEQERTLYLHILPGILDRLEGVKGDVIRVSLDIFDKPPCQSETN